MLLKTIAAFILIAVNVFVWYKAFEEDIIQGRLITLAEFYKPTFETALLGVQTTLHLKPQPLESKLDEVVAKALEGTKGKYSVVIKNLKTGEGYSQKETEVYEPASLYKLWVMATVFEKIKNGELKEDQVLSQNIATLNQKFGIAPEDAELTSGGITQTVTEALDQMITISHNYSALLLAEKVGNSQIKEYLDRNGFAVSDLGDPPKTNASEIAKFYEKLYRGEIVDQASSRKMLEILKKQELNDGLPKQLPQSTPIAHKTGDLGWFKHDAGIVFNEKGDYIIVVLSESDSPPGAQERIAQLSKAVYDYFTP